MTEQPIGINAAYCDAPQRVCVPTMRERLEQKRTTLRAALADVDAALDALDKHPDVEAVMDLVQKATY